MDFLSSRFLIACIIILLIVRYLLRSRLKKGESLNERLWRKIAFAHCELFSTMDEQEKELLKHTYLNTVHNARPIKIGQLGEIKHRMDKHVSFNLEGNQFY